VAITTQSTVGYICSFTVHGTTVYIKLQQPTRISETETSNVVIPLQLHPVNTAFHSFFITDQWCSQKRFIEVYSKSKHGKQRCWK